jgi:hypothetical protein
MGLPVSGQVAMSVSGQSIFPLYNNVGQIAHEECEVDQCSAHAGQGFDYHYHGDPFHPTSGKCLYSLEDYSSDTAHPPLIGWSMDGFDIFGRHLNLANLGVNVTLDACGGHIHNDASGTAMQYHYHSQVLNTTLDVQGTMRTFLYYPAGVLNCWKGDMTNTNFFGNTVSTTDRADYEDLKPCCSSTEYYTASGYNLGLSTPSKSPSSTLVPSNKPSLAPTGLPVTVQPTVKAGDPIPSRKPTSIPTLTPTIAVPSSAKPTVLPTLQVAPIISFTVSISLGGLSSPSLNDVEQQSLVNATASSMKISEKYIEYSTSTSTSSRRHLTSHSALSTYTVVSTVSLVIPLIDLGESSASDSTTVYDDLVANLKNAVTNGDFVSSFQSANAARGGTTVLGVGSVSVSYVSALTIDGAPTAKPTSSPASTDALSTGSVIGIAVGGGGMLLLLLVGVYFRCSRNSADKVQPV